MGHACKLSKVCDMKTGQKGSAGRQKGMRWGLEREVIYLSLGKRWLRAKLTWYILQKCLYSYHCHGAVAPCRQFPSLHSIPVREGVLFSLFYTSVERAHDLQGVWGSTRGSSRVLVWFMNHKNILFLEKVSPLCIAWKRPC